MNIAIMITEKLVQDNLDATEYKYKIDILLKKNVNNYCRYKNRKRKHNKTDNFYLYNKYCIIIQATEKTV